MHFAHKKAKLLRATAATAVARLSRCNSICRSVRPSVRYMGGSVKNDAS